MVNLEEIMGMNLKALRSEWARSEGDQPPRVASAEFLRFALAWNAQAEAVGGLSAKAKRRLQQLEKAFARDPDYQPHALSKLRPGTVLTREWQGKPHRVRVLVDAFEYRGKRYRSLSETARAITGTRWSGPLFFGLKGSAA